LARPKVENSSEGKGRKVAIREAALEWAAPSRVFDAFCGTEGAMHAAVWSRAESYVGCDTEWTPADARRRLVCDNRRALRVLELEAFNVFDLDAFGSPWEQALIIAHRRRWEPGERGALVVTDGSGLRTRFGFLPAALARLVGIESRGTAPTEDAHEGLLPLALRRWAKLSGVQPRRALVTRSRGRGKGGSRMFYAALLFEGQSASEA